MAFQIHHWQSLGVKSLILKITITAATLSKAKAKTTTIAATTASMRKSTCQHMINKLLLENTQLARNDFCIVLVNRLADEWNNT